MAIKIRTKLQSRVKGRFTRFYSSCISNLNYDDLSGSLMITFHNPTIGTWRYYNVDQYTANSLIWASSKGEYFNMFIRGYFPYDRIG